ncbi:MAG: glycosyltransferase [Oscillospiraceae bacterium]|nr:glycosyltransferase [Oscillospiraceae bacterium]
MENSEKKILIVTALTGFIRAFILDDIKILQSMGYTVDCAANGELDDRTIEDNREFFKNIGVNFFHIPFSSNNPFSKSTLKSYKAFRKIIKNTHYDAVHIHTPIPGVVCRTALMFKRKQTKIIYTTHGFYFHKYSSKKTWLVFHTIEKVMSRFTHCIITINNEDFNNAKKMHCKNVYHINGVGVETSKYENIEIDRREYRRKLGIQDNEIALLSVGELSDRKNHKIVIEAMNKLKDLPLVYLICGRINKNSGTYTELKQLSDNLGVRVIFLDYRRDIPEISKSCDIGALPSTREGLGLAGIEMLAAGLPLVASNVHGIVDFAVDGQTAYTANPYSEDEFAQAIKKLSDKDLREKMRDNCISKAKEFDMAISHKQRKEIYENIL